MNKLLTITFLLSLLFSACSVSQPQSPTEVLKTFVEASKKKDTETLKKVLSKDSWKMMEEAAQEQELSVKDLIEKNISGNQIEKTMSEFGEEKIDGNEATVKVKNSINGVWGETYFLKEDGNWKVDFVKPLKKLEDSFQENILDKELK